MASVTKNGENVWRAQVYVCGKRKSKTFRTKREALAWGSIVEMHLKAELRHRRELEEKIGRSMSLVSAEEILGKRTPTLNAPGIYILFSGDQVTYIGQSRNVLARIASHAEKGRAFTSYYAMPCLECDLDKTERYYIKMLSPPGNKQ